MDSKVDKNYNNMADNDLAADAQGNLLARQEKNRLSHSIKFTKIYSKNSSITFSIFSTVFNEVGSI